MRATRRERLVGDVSAPLFRVSRAPERVVDVRHAAENRNRRRVSFSSGVPSDDVLSRGADPILPGVPSNDNLSCSTDPTLQASASGSCFFPDRFPMTNDAIPSNDARRGDDRDARDFVVGDAFAFENDGSFDWASIFTSATDI